MSFILLVEQTAPETPSTNQVIFYPKSDGRLYSKDDAGTERIVSVSDPVPVGNGGTGAATAADARTNLGVPAIGVASMQVFTSSDTWTRPSGVQRVVMEVQGAGGGSGGGLGATNTTSAGGRGAGGR